MRFLGITLRRSSRLLAEPGDAQCADAYREH
jgi:hypothetical protein